jgi:ubiquinone/menaquinone biosynthesis C-methylase UbiE
MKRLKIPNVKYHPIVEGDFLTKCYHAPFVNLFFMKRLSLAFNFIQNEHFESLLEIGFGSGVFFPQLNQVSDKLYGLDFHSKFDEVKNMLELENIKAELKKGNVTDLPYEDDFFDCVVSISVLEHVKEIDKAVSEIWRVLKRNGVAVLGFPVANIITDLLLILMGSEHDHQKKLREIHPNSHRDIISAINNKFGTKVIVKSIPSFIPLDGSLYCCCFFRKNSTIQV